MAKIPLSLPRDPEEILTAFDGDVMDRKVLAEKITPAITQLAVNGGVLTLDAPWGEGKSWFGRHWRKMLDEEGLVTTCWIDAFEQDYIENPFELVASELVEAMGWRDNEELIDKTVSVLGFGERTLTMVAKSLGRGLAVIGAAHLGGGPDAKAIEAISGVAADGVAQGIASGTTYLRQRLLSHSLEKKTIREFRDAMRIQLADQPKPIVVFVDELDRCRPDFAVRLLECIKHFFDLPNLVFVLLLNRDQMEKAVKGIYGAEVDAHLYLQKFIHLSVKLPRGGWNAENQIRRFLEPLFVARFNYRPTTTSDLISFLAPYAIALNLSLRDMERVVAALILRPAPPIAAYLFPLCLKVKNEVWFDGFRNRDTSVWREIGDVCKVNMRLHSVSDNFALSMIQRFWEEWISDGPINPDHFGTWGQRVRDIREFYSRELGEINVGIRSSS